MIALILLFLAAPNAEAERQHTIASPNGQIAVTLTERDGDLYFRATHRGRGFVLDSRLGLEGIQPEWAKAKTTEHRSRRSWKPVYGERETIPDRYNAITLSTPQLSVAFRVYDEGIAFRYELPAGRPEKIGGELTTFHFPSGTLAWEEYGTEGEYARVVYDDIKEKCERPLTLEFPTGFVGALLEAEQTDWPRMLLAPTGDGAIQIYREGAIDLKQTTASPWRVLMAGESPGELLERNYLVMNLNPAVQLKALAWIRPGKVIREVTLSTTGGRRAVDFCVKHGLQFVEYDAGWYGHEYDDKADATQVAPDPDRIKNIPNHGGLDLQEVIRYAKQRGIGIILYVNRRALERQMDTIFPLYEKWGVTGVKFGFVNVQGQEWAKWLRDAVAKAGEHNLMVDVHDSYRPSGITRTWPNLMTQEGVRGNEHMPSSRHNATLPFTRALAGAYDYTICWMTPRLKTTRGHQMAQSVIHYSPWQFLFWYDRPDDVEESPQLEWFRELPTVWDETRVPDGEIGTRVAIARRSGDTWFVGAITNEQARKIEVSLPFVKGDRKVSVYCDGPVRQEFLKSRGTLAFDLPSNGGCGAIVRPPGR